MEKKYGVTTLGRWLTEALPRGVKCYIEIRGRMMELLGVTGWSGALRPVLRPTGEGRMLQRFTAMHNPVTLSTQVVLSLDDELNNVDWDRVTQQLRPSAPDCCALTYYLAGSGTVDGRVDADLPLSNLYYG